MWGEKRREEHVPGNHISQVKERSCTQTINPKMLSGKLWSEAKGNEGKYVRHLLGTERRKATFSSWKLSRPIFCKELQDLG